MNKIALLLTAMLVAGVATVKMTGSSCAVSWDWQAEQRQQEAISSYECFKSTFSGSLDDLAMSQISLREAHDRVYLAARRYRPEYLQWLGRAEEGATDSERLARSLVGHLRCIADVRPHLQPRLRELEVELQEFVRMVNSNGRLTESI